MFHFLKELNAGQKSEILKLKIANKVLLVIGPE